MSELPVKIGDNLEVKVHNKCLVRSQSHFDWLGSNISSHIKNVAQIQVRNLYLFTVLRFPNMIIRKSTVKTTESGRLKHITLPYVRFANFLFLSVTRRSI